MLVELRMEVEQRLLQTLQAVNPHLGRRECVHPGDHTDTFLVGVGCHHHVFHFVGVVGCALIYDFDGQASGIVQAGYHLFGVSVYLLYCVTSVKELCSGDPPNL